MDDRAVVNISPTNWCALCCSNICYCSKQSLMGQVAHALRRIKEQNEQYDQLLEQANKLEQFIKSEELYLTNGTIDCEQEYHKILKAWSEFKKAQGFE